MMNPNLNSFQQRYLQAVTRRHFLQGGGYGLGGLALAQLMGNPASAEPRPVTIENPLEPKTPPLPAKAKRVIYLHMAGSPPQQELFDYKPKLVEQNMQPCPDELLAIMEKERLPFINLKQGRPKLLGTPYKFAQHGESGQSMSELLPHLSKHADDLCIVKSMWTDQFNHAPAQLLLYTGSNRFGAASMGSWTTYGLGSENQNLPGFIVMISGGTDPSGGKSLWGNGFLPSVYQGVQCRTVGEPILYVSNPKG
jgi:hypothetical protein